MPFTGFHVSFHEGGRDSYAGEPLPILGDTLGSDSLTNAGTTTVLAPIAQRGQCVARIATSVDAWVSFSISPATPGDPNLATTPRMLVLASTPVEMFVDPNTRFRWVAA